MILILDVNELRRDMEAAERSFLTRFGLTELPNPWLDDTAAQHTQEGEWDSNLYR